MNAILQISHVDMCLKLSRTRHQLLKFHMKKLSGKCKGPLLELTMNEKLNHIEVGEFLSDLKKKRDSIRIRGNPLLTDEVLEKFKGFHDVQRGGECAMPPQLDTTVDFGNCTHLYGPLLVGSNVQRVELHGEESYYVYTGCIKINGTKLVDLTFLESFQDFTAMPDCKQYITRNAELCVEDIPVLRKWFPGIRIYDNLEPCGEHQCLGGAVTESYLAQTAD
ncbi:hypothetical protein Aduo_003330 [Ancylostoma duodenale]